MSLYTLQSVQKIPSSINDLWNFISSPANLKIITPDYMGFNIKTRNLPEKMFSGMLISYDVSPFKGIRINWISEITHIKEFEYFIDEQRFGPYKFWHHLHNITPIEAGVLMTDTVRYKPPFCVLGKIANYLFIRKRLNEIFDYRTKKIEEIFGKFKGNDISSIKFYKE